MQPLTLPERRIIEAIVRDGIWPMARKDWETVRRTLKIALETNEVLEREWRKADNKTVV